MQEDLFYSKPTEGKTFIYRSSAGSGKTFTLAKAFLKLVLLDPSRYNKILAITFTNKAKDEMKSRIIDYLSSLSADEPSDMRTAIIEDFKNEGIERIDDVITSRAQLVLNSLLHDYSRFHVSTIDHFFTRLIRHLAKELKLNLGYELDVDSTKALADSIELLFKAADKNLLRWLNDFAIEQIENEKGWDIRKNIADLGKKLFQESYLDIEDSLSKNTDALPGFINSNRQIVKKYKEKLTEVAKKGVQTATSAGLAQADFNRGVPLNFMVKVAEGNYNFSELPSQSFLNATTIDKWHTKTSTKVELISQARDAGMLAAYDELINLFEGGAYSEYIEASAILRYIHSYGVLSSLSTCVQEYRTEHNLMFISDSAFILHDVITEAETPFVYEKMGAEIGYILIDEFQDTSTYQWKSLLPFFSSVLADGGQAYVVGDVKQSIYGWRGGDLNLLLHQVEKDLNVGDIEPGKPGKNFRSAINIVNFNNSFFKTAASILPGFHNLDQFREEFELAYYDVKQIPNKEYDGLVKVVFLKDEKENKWIEQSHEMVKEKILTALEEGFSRNDILLLTRKTAESTRIANYLLEEGIPAISETALKITSSSKVQLIIAALKHIDNQQSKVAIAEFNHFWNLVHESSTQTYAIIPEKLSACLPLASRPIYETIEELIIHLALNQSTDIYLLKFLDLVLIQSNRGNSTISSFLEWWHEQEERDSQDFSLSIPESEDAVMVLTVHKAKGLEKPVVILPYADDNMKPKSDIFWAKPLPEKYAGWGSLPLNFSTTLDHSDFQVAYQKQYFDTLLESLNLLYVAFTRASERLIVISKIPKKESRTSGALIYTILQNAQFDFSSEFDNNAELFILGANEAKQGSSKTDSVHTDIRELNSYPLTANLVIDQKQQELFLEIAGAKSEKVREGIILHKILALLPSIDQIDQVLTKIENEGLITSKDRALYHKKIEELFTKLPELKLWFNDRYEVINERKIFYKQNTHIPDRVMIGQDEVLIIDYKREQQDEKHHKQISRYRDLLVEMGYENIRMYLIYIDDLILIEVNG